MHQPAGPLVDRSSNAYLAGEITTGAGLMCIGGGPALGEKLSEAAGRRAFQRVADDIARDVANAPARRAAKAAAEAAAKQPRISVVKQGQVSRPKRKIAPQKILPPGKYGSGF